VVDHIDGNRANNCHANIRVCIRAQNMHNKRKCTGSRSRFKCVYYSRQLGKWYAGCWFDGRHHLLGYFDSKVEAARAYDRLAVTFFDEFARLNFPREWTPERRAEACAHRQELAGKVKVRRPRKTKDAGIVERKRVGTDRAVSGGGGARFVGRPTSDATSRATLSSRTPIRDATAKRALRRGRGEPKRKTKGRRSEGKKVRKGKT